MIFLLSILVFLMFGLTLYSHWVENRPHAKQHLRTNRDAHQMFQFLSESRARDFHA
jgi:hypothetical protein